jgi:uncharacterized damage-inducible protein DinB
VTDTDSRGDLRPPSLNADEKTTLLAFLDYLRDAVAAKASGVSDRAVRTAGVPSGTSILGLVKHLAAVELNWFAWAHAGADVALWDDESEPAGSETAESLLASYREAVRRCNGIIEACDDLDQPGARSLRETAPPSMRWVLVHMIEETARHAGHADILREQIDGSVGR